MSEFPGFSGVTIEQLAQTAPACLDELTFGVIGFNSHGKVEVYNRTESNFAGLSMARVIGRHFFAEVGICMNNYLVAQRFEDEPMIDATIDYVLTLRMRPTPVKLRLLKRPGAALSYILVER